MSALPTTPVPWLGDDATPGEVCEQVRILGQILTHYAAHAVQLRHAVRRAVHQSNHSHPLFDDRVDDLFDEATYGVGDVVRLLGVPRGP